MSHTTLCLPNPHASQNSERPSAANGGVVRASHPPGGSTLITSAPRSASVLPAISAMRVVRSRTLIPSRAPLMAIRVAPNRKTPGTPGRNWAWQGADVATLGRWPVW